MGKAPVSFSSAMESFDYPGVIEITAEELKNRVNEVHVIDVRRPDEFSGELGHIAGARLIVLNTIPERLLELPRDGALVFVCLMGGRSAKAAMFAKENGVTQVYNLQGGMLRWNQLGYPIEK